MANSSSSKVAVDPALGVGPGGADAPEGRISNPHLGSLTPVSRGTARRGPRSRKASLRARLDALYADVLRTAEASRLCFDGPGKGFRAGLAPEAAAAAAIEALAITSRLLALMNWLLQPAHDGEPPALQPFLEPPLPPLPAGHPLAGTPGGEVAQASRALVARAHALAAAPDMPADAALASGPLLR